MEEPTAIKDDSLITPEIGAWGEEKYRLVALYSTLFAKSMKHKWECLVYIDLFAGSGRSRIRGTTRIVNASPLVVLGLSYKFDRYIFCEQNSDKLDTLKMRIVREHPQVDAYFIEGDANKKTAEILGKMPDYKKNFRILAFCFVDPYSLGNLQFETIRQLSVRFMDFLVLIPSGMQAQRFEHDLVRPDNLTIDNFVRNKQWRSIWFEVHKKGMSFERFIIQEFGESMKTLGYLNPSFDDTKLIRSDEKNLLLYRLAMYSRNKLGKTFWQQAKKYSQTQQKMF